MGVQHTMLRVWHTQTHVTAAEVRVNLGEVEQCKASRGHTQCYNPFYYACLAYWGRSARLGRPGVALGRPFTPV